MNINEKVKAYQESKSEPIFNEIYDFVYSENGGGLIVKLVSKYCVDFHDIESAVNLCITNAVNKYDAERGDFMGLLRISITNACKNLTRSQTPISENEQSLQYFEDDDEGYSENEQATYEDCVINEVRNNLDQKRLVAELLAHSDEKTLESIAAYVHNDYSYRQAAKAIGVSDKTIKARIRRAARHFDGEKMGDPTDYFTTATTTV